MREGYFARLRFFSPPFYQFFGRFKGHFCYLLRIDKLICFFRSLGEEPFLHNLSLFVQNQNFPIRVKNLFKASLKKFWLTPAWLPPIWPTEMNRVSLASNWTRALIWSPLLWTLFRRLSPPDAPLTINLEKKITALLNNSLQQFLYSNRPKNSEKKSGEVIFSSKKIKLFSWCINVHNACKVSSKIA